MLGPCRARWEEKKCMISNQKHKKVFFIYSKKICHYKNESATFNTMKHERILGKKKNKSVVPPFLLFVQVLLPFSLKGAHLLNLSACSLPKVKPRRKKQKETPYSTLLKQGRNTQFSFLFFYWNPLFFFYCPFFCLHLGLL